MKTTKAFANTAFVWMCVVSLYNQNNVNGAPVINNYVDSNREVEIMGNSPQHQLKSVPINHERGVEDQKGKLVRPIPIHGNNIQEQQVNGSEDHVPNASHTESSLTGNENSGHTHLDATESEDIFHDANDVPVAHEIDVEHELKELNGHHHPTNADSSLTGNRTSELSKSKGSESEDIFHDADSDTEYNKKLETAEIVTREVAALHKGLHHHHQEDDKLKQTDNTENTVASDATKSDAVTSNIHQDAETQSKPVVPVVPDDLSSGPSHSEGLGSEQELQNENSAHVKAASMTESSSDSDSSDRLDRSDHMLPAKFARLNEHKSDRSSGEESSDEEASDKKAPSKDIIKTLKEDAELAKKELGKANEQQPLPNADGHKPTENTERMEGDNQGAEKKLESQLDYTSINNNNHMLQPDAGKDTEIINEAEKKAEETWRPLEEKAEQVEEAREIGKPESILQPGVSGNTQNVPGTIAPMSPRPKTKPGTFSSPSPKDKPKTGAIVVKPADTIKHGAIKPVSTNNLNDRRTDPQTNKGSKDKGKTLIQRAQSGFMCCTAPKTKE